MPPHFLCSVQPDFRRAVVFGAEDGTDTRAYPINEGAMFTRGLTRISGDRFLAFDNDHANNVRLVVYGPGGSSVESPILFKLSMAVNHAHLLHTDDPAEFITLVGASWGQDGKWWGWKTTVGEDSGIQFQPVTVPNWMGRVQTAGRYLLVMSQNQTSFNGPMMCHVHTWVGDKFEPQWSFPLWDNSAKACPSACMIADGVIAVYEHYMDWPTRTSINVAMIVDMQARTVRRIVPIVPNTFDLKYHQTDLKAMWLQDDGRTLCTVFTSTSPVIQYVVCRTDTHRGRARIMCTEKKAMCGRELLASLLAA